VNVSLIYFGIREHFFDGLQTAFEEVNVHFLKTSPRDIRVEIFEVKATSVTRMGGDHITRSE